MKNTTKMSCGACGWEEFNIEADNDDSPTVLVFECTKCHSTTVYKINTPTMRRDWGDNSEGVTCFFERNKNSYKERELRDLDNPVTDYWLKYYIDPNSGLCALCGNTGIIHIETIRNPSGQLARLGFSDYCICPNGQSMRENNNTE
jgi:hypothetical protein